MNGIMKRTDYEAYCDNTKEKLTAEDCNFSGYSMVAIAGGILLCIGIVLYALLTA